MTSVPLKDKNAKNLVGDKFRIFGVTSKNNLDTVALEKDYSKTAFGLDYLSRIAKIIKIFDEKPENFEIWFPKGDGLLVLFSRHTSETVFLCAPRMEPIKEIPK